MARKKKLKLPTWTHPLAYAGLRTAIACGELAGVERAAHAMRRAGGSFGGAKFNQSRLERAISNIAWSFPEIPATRRRWLALEAYRHLFGLAAEMAVVPTLLTAENWPQYITLKDYTRVTDLMDAKRPLILIGGHCGNWELLGQVMAMLGYPMHALYRPLDMKPVNNWVVRERARHGIQLIDKFGASDVLPGLMEKGEPIAFVADQNAGDRGLFVPFFGRLSSAYKSIALLAMRHGAHIACGHARRVGQTDGSGPYFRYTIDTVDFFGPDDWERQPDPIYYITARYRRAIEGMVRLSPEQYLWMHRYWKSRPRHEREGREFPENLKRKIEALPWMDEASLDRIVERSAKDAEEFAARRQTSART
ncbi:MAG: lysophospholipid acyltransferase family protein [Planctomycetota bacterium]